MRFAKRVIIAVGMDEHMPEFLKPIHSMDFLNHSEVHFVHVFNIITYAYGFGSYPLIYPIEADRKIIQESVLARLAKAARETLPVGFEGKSLERCLFDENPKAAFSNYVNEVKADLVIVPTRKKRGIFESSFAQYVNKHTDANLIFLKTHKE